MNVKSELLNYYIIPGNQWNYYEIPIGEDWYNKYGYYPVIDKIHYINDNDACNGIVLFDAISIESEGGVVYFDNVSVVKKDYDEVEGGERVYYYHNDHLGTPQVMTDISGNVVWKAVYEPFGRVGIVVCLYICVHVPSLPGHIICEVFCEYMSYKSCEMICTETCYKENDEERDREREKDKNKRKIKCYD